MTNGDDSESPTSTAAESRAHQHEIDINTDDYTESAPVRRPVKKHHRIVPPPKNTPTDTLLLDRVASWSRSMPYCPQSIDDDTEWRTRAHASAIARLERRIQELHKEMQCQMEKLDLMRRTSA